MAENEWQIQIKAEESHPDFIAAKTEAKANAIGLHAADINAEDTGNNRHYIKNEEDARFWDFEVNFCDEDDSGEESFCANDDQDSSEDFSCSDDEVADPSNELTPESSQHSSPGRSRGRLCGRLQQESNLLRSRSRSPLQPRRFEPWNTEEKQDVCPEALRFVPSRTVGHQLNPSLTYTPLDLFKLYLSENTVKTVCTNTNKQAAKRVDQGKRFSWTRLTPAEFYKYVGLTLFFALVRLPSIPQYWRKKTIFSQPFPPTVMSRDRYQAISWNIHMSDPHQDKDNNCKKGTPGYDNFFLVKPLMADLQKACRTYYQPHQNLSVVERMTAKAQNVMNHYAKKPKPNKWGFNFFVLADSSNKYMLDFNVCSGKWGQVAYDSVMTLIKRTNLGCGYTLYMNNCFTSPQLLRDLYRINVGACGTYRDNGRECPHSSINALEKSDPKGSIRWIRDGPVVFVKWRDSREVSICSTVHQAFSGQTIQRRVRRPDRSWASVPIPCPAPFIDYYKNMGGGDLTDELIQYYSVHHKTLCWYKTLFLNFLDIAATNCYVLHKELCKERQQQPLSHRVFLEELTAQLCGVTVDLPEPRPQSAHVPVPTSTQTDVSKMASYGRKACVLCRRTKKVNQSTPWKCKACDTALCLVPNRNCFEIWHQ